MSVNNIYDTFLAIRIEPDTKNRLMEIRDLTETIIKNRDNINNMSEELERIVSLQSKITSQQITDIYKMSGQTDVTDALKKFVEPFTEASFENIREDKIDEIARNWGISEEEVGEKLAEIGNILRARLVETATDPTKESADELNQVLDKLDILSAKDLKIREVDKILNYITKMDEQTFYFSKILGDLQNMMGTGVGIDITKKYEYTPDVPKKMTSRERLLLGQYKAAERKGQILKPKKGLTSFEDIAKTFREEGDEASVRQFLRNLKRSLDGKKISIRRILDPTVAATFFDEIMGSDMFTDAYKDVLRLLVTESAANLELTIYDKNNFENFIEEIIKDSQDEEFKRYMEDWAKEKVKEFEQDPQLESIIANIPIVPSSKYNPRQDIAEAMEDPEYRALSPGPSESIDVISNLIEDNRNLLSETEDNIKMLVNEIEKLPDKSIMKDIQQAIKKVGDDINSMRFDKDTAIDGDIL